MSSSILLIVFLYLSNKTTYPFLTWSHVDLRILLKVELRQLSIVVQSFTLVLEVVVCEEAGVDMLAQELPELKDHLILDHLK